jgi:hypothetical protein
MLLPMLSGESAITVGGDWIGEPALDAEDGMGVETSVDMDSGGMGAVDLSAEDPLGAELDARPGRW